MGFVYATTGPNAGGIGWYDFGPNFTLTPGQTKSLSGTLGNGITVSFDVRLNLSSGNPRNYAAVPAPIPGAYFGLVGYAGLTGFPILLGDTGVANNLSSLVFSNIVVKNALGNPMANYTMVVADGENTSGDAINQEGLSFLTNGGNWATLTTLGNTNPPQFVGGGAFVGLIGVSAPPNTAYVFTSQGPTQVVVGLSAPLGTDRNGIAIGFAATQVELYKNINGRRFPVDQFQLNIGGTPSNLATTTGAANGVQSAYATLSAIPGNTYSINEAMAPGSLSTIADYTKTVTAVNLTTGGTIPVVGPLPESITPALGDIIQYTIKNDPNPVVAKTVAPEFAAPGDTLTYTVTVRNPNATVAATNVLLSDLTPAGTTYAGNLNVDVAFTGTDPNSGLTLTSIPPLTTATISWDVTVNAGTPVANPITNVATISGANYSYTTPPVQTQINYADIGATGNFLKTASPAGVVPGGTITYTMTLQNNGNVAANNIVITDPVPTGTTFVAGSVTGATGTPPTLIVPSIAAGGNTTVTFQVTVDPGTVGPVLNTASVDYTFTVDPDVPDGGSGTGTSTTASTPINFADVSMTKTAAPAGVPAGGIITYTITFNNAGNVPANNVVINDSVPTGSTFVAGSVTGATGTPPTMTLIGSVPAGGTAVVTFQVEADNTAVPIVNSATANYTFTADPDNPNAESGSAASGSVTTPVNTAELTMTKTSDKTYVQPGDVITYTITLQNTGNVSANNVVVTDNLPVGTTFVAGSLIGATGAPPTLNVASIPAGTTATIKFQVTVDVGNQGPISNTATSAFTFTADPANPDGESGTGASTPSTTQVSYASLTSTKSVAPSFADKGDVLTYTIVLQNTGNAVASNVVITDPVPAGTTFVPGSVTGATGTPPTLNVAVVPAGGSVTVTYQVKLGNSLPNPNPVLNTASTAYTYTVNPANPNGASAVSVSNTIGAQVNNASFKFVKTADKSVAYLNDIITYQIAMTNTGNVPANNVVITDPIPAGTLLVPGSMTVSVSYTPLPGGAIQLNNPVLPGETILISFKILVTSIPNPNPIVNIATATFTYTVDPQNPDGASGTATSNAFTTAVFRNNFSQQISDLIESVALEQAALAALAQAEGAKIQKLAAMDGVTSQELLCLNKSVSDMTDSLAMLEAVLKQKLSIVNCQIDGGAC